MRFSVKDPAFPWFEPMQCSAYQLEVHVDGERQFHCFAFDTVEGWADRYIPDGTGLKQLANGEPATERVRGHVTVLKKALP